MAHQAPALRGWTVFQFGWREQRRQFHRAIWFSAPQSAHHQHADTEAAIFRSFRWSTAALRWRAFASLLLCERKTRGGGRWA
eukprot:4818261-Alexandrium_andersonii.AAC.1